MPARLDLLTSRQSIRRYRGEPVDAGLIGQLLGAAIRAPSAHNRQPWRFAVLGPARRRRLANAMADNLRRDRHADGDAQDAVEADAARSIARITGAGGAILVSLTIADMDHYPDPTRNAAELTMAVQSVAAACQNMLITAHALGLGASWMCAPLFCGDTVRGALDLPNDWQPQALITFGWPLATPPMRARRPLSEVSRLLD